MNVIVLSVVGLGLLCVCVDVVKVYLFFLLEEYCSLCNLFGNFFLLEVFFDLIGVIFLWRWYGVEINESKYLIFC